LAGLVNQEPQDLSKKLNNNQDGPLNKSCKVEFSPSTWVVQTEQPHVEGHGPCRAYAKFRKWCCRLFHQTPRLFRDNY